MVTRKDLATWIRERIEAGEWAVGDMLPTTSQFAEEYDTSGSTVYNAMEILKDRGYVTGVRGGRRYVADWGQPVTEQ